jgi:arabinogalactan endo-1,4-beta-galactosidase
MSKDLLLTCVDKLQAKMKQSLMDVASTHNQQVLIVKLSHFYSLENRFKNWILLNWAFSK